MNFTHTKRIDWFGNFHCEKWLIGSVVMEIWWQNYWILLLFSNQMCKITHSQIRFLVPLFFKTINDFQALFKENFPFSRHIEKSSTFQDRIQIQALFKVCGNHGPVNSLFSQVECSFTTERIKMILYRLCQENRKIYGFFFKTFVVSLYRFHCTIFIFTTEKWLDWVLTVKLLSGEFHRAWLTHCSRVMHICVCLNIIGSDNGMSSCRHQAII